MQPGIGVSRIRDTQKQGGAFAQIRSRDNSLPRQATAVDTAECAAEQVAGLDVTARRCPLKAGLNLRDFKLAKRMARCFSKPHRFDHRIVEALARSARDIDRRGQQAHDARQIFTPGRHIYC